MRRLTAKHLTALFAALFLVLAASCVSRQNCLVCTDVIVNTSFVKFDSSYVSRKELQNIWILDSVRRAVANSLSDTLIILASKALFYPLHILVVSDSGFIDISYKVAKYPETFPAVKYYDSYPDGGMPYDSIEGATISSWDIDKLSSILQCQHCSLTSGPAHCILVKAVLKKNRIRSWEEYRFDDPMLWTDCNDSSYLRDFRPDLL